MYGATLSEADQRYIRAFGAPEFSPGGAHNPSTPGMSIQDAQDEEDYFDALQHGEA